MTTTQIKESPTAQQSRDSRTIAVLFSGSLLRFIEEEAAARGGSCAEIIREAVYRFQRANAAETVTA